MNSDASVPASVLTIPQPLVEGDPNPQVRFKSEGGRLLLLLPPETEVSGSTASWSEIWHQFKNRLNAGDRFWQADTVVHLVARDRLLDVRQLQDIADTLSDYQLDLQRVYTSRRQTAVAAATIGYSVEQHSPVAHLNPTAESGQALADPLYLQTTVRSGMEIRHSGTIVIFGDANPGSSVIADGDVIVWGNLRGVAQAGASGNSRCLIMALRLEPTQIRIASYVARAPETPPAQYYPEVAYVTPEGIRITRAIDFHKGRLLSQLS
jgi:septum site-determining protein MinC